MAEVRPEEVSAILRKQLAGFEKETDIYDVGTVLQVGDGVARVYGLTKALMSELVEFPHGVFGMVLNLEEDNVGLHPLRRKPRDQGRRYGQTDRSRGIDARRGTDARTRDQCARPADRRPRTDPHRHISADRAQGARRDPAPAGQGTAPDRSQGRGRHDPDRARTARADHRRPADREDGRRARRDHQPTLHAHARSKGAGDPAGVLHLRCHRTEELDGCAGGGQAAGRKVPWRTRR